MKIAKRFGRRVLVLMTSILLIDAASAFAETDEPGPFQRLFRAMRHGFNEPHHKSSSHRSSHKQSSENANTSTSGSDSTSQTTNANGNVNKPPDEKNTRSTSRANSKRGEDLPYGTPVPGKQGFVTSPFSPSSGYIDVRGFAPGTPVKDPYTGKVFLTP